MRFIFNKRSVLYFLFTLAAIGFFLHVRFPGQIVERYIVSALTQRYPGVFLALGSTALKFPPALEMANVLFGFTDDLEANIRLDRFLVQPRLADFLGGRPSFAVHAVAYDGQADGFVQFPGFSLQGRPSLGELQFDGLSIEKCMFLVKKFGPRVRGKAGGTLTYGGDARLVFTMRNGSVLLAESLYGIKSLDFKNADGDLTLKDNLLTITRFRLNGDVISCSLKGDIRLDRDVTNSVININGTIDIANMNKKISFQLTGTLDKVQTRYL